MRGGTVFVSFRGASIAHQKYDMESEFFAGCATFYCSFRARGLYFLSFVCHFNNMSAVYCIDAQIPGNKVLWI